MEARCYFADRCPKAMEACLKRPPTHKADEDGTHLVNCVLAEREYGDSPPLPDDYFEPGSETGSRDSPTDEAATEGGDRR